MDEDENYDSDSTVLIKDIFKNPERIARKRRKLDATYRRLSQTNIQANDAENTAPNAPRSVSRVGKRNRCNNIDTEQWRINKFFSSYEPISNNVNDSLSEVLKIKKELLKQENGSNSRISDNNCDKEVKEVCVVISDDSDDDCTIVNNELNRQVDKNPILNPRISVLTPSTINTRRATLASFESDEPVKENDPAKSTNSNKILPKLTVLKPAAINARRATFDSFERNDSTSKNVDKSATNRVDFSSNETKNKGSNDNKTNEKVIETDSLSKHKRTREHPLKPTTVPDHNEISRKRNSSGVVQGKPGDLLIRRVVSSSKDSNENAGAIEMVKRNPSTSSSSVMHSTAEVLDGNIQKMSRIQEKVDAGAINDNDFNKIDAGHHITTKINSINNVCKDVIVNNNNNVIDFGNSDVKDQTTNSPKRPVDIDVFDGSKKGNEDSSSVNKSTYAKQVTVDKNTLNNNNSCNTVVNNTNSVESPILQNLKNIMNFKIVPQKEDSFVLDEIVTANDHLSKANKSDDGRVGTDIQTGNNDVQCCNVVTKTAELKRVRTDTDTQDKNENAKENCKTKLGSTTVPPSNLLNAPSNNDTKTSDFKCSVCTCVFSSPNILNAHMKDNHNCNNIPDENENETEIVGSNNTTSKCKNQNVTSAETQHQNKAEILTSSGAKQYECKICKEVLYSVFMAKKHRNEVHGNLDLKNKKLYNVTERKRGLRNSDIQSRTSVEHTSEGNNKTSGSEDDIPNQESGSVGRGEMNRREENRRIKMNEAAAPRKDDVEKSNDDEKNCNNGTDLINIQQNCDENNDEEAKTNKERKRKPSQNSNIIQEVKQTNVTKSIKKTVYKCLICKKHFQTDYGSRRHREEEHPDFINKHIFDKVTITDVAQIDKGKSSAGGTGEKSRTNKDDQYEINLINDFLGELENEVLCGSSDSTKTKKVTKPHETFEDVDNNGNAEKIHRTRVSEVLPTNVEMVNESDILHETNAQRGVTVVSDSSSRTEVHEAMKLGDTIDINIDSTENPNKERYSEYSPSKSTSVDETNKLSDTNISQNVDDKLNSEVEDKIGDQKKPTRKFPIVSKSEPTLANCYNCRTNLDVNDINNHGCSKLFSTLSNGISDVANLHQDDKHECGNGNISCIENIQITNVKTVKELHVFKCKDCNTATDIYDEIIRHSQNHYNNIKDTTAFCETCQSFYNTAYFETHKHLHENDVKITNYSYKYLFTNWDKIFDSIPKDIAREMQLQSIYRSPCVKMKVTEVGPWQYSLYQCNQCETCVPPERLDEHCHNQCCLVAYPCSECKKLFPSAPMRTNHELHHRDTKKFKTIEFNCKKDEHFNRRLFEARKLEWVTGKPPNLIVDLYKCQCSLFFISDEIFRKHFVTCNMESDKCTICHRCTVPRLFEESQLDAHLRLHHSLVTFQFRVNRLVIQQEVEPFDFNGGERNAECQPLLKVCSAEDDIKRELLKQDNLDHTVSSGHSSQND